MLAAKRALFASGYDAPPSCYASMSIAPKRELWYRPRTQLKPTFSRSFMERFPSLPVPTISIVALLLGQSNMNFKFTIRFFTPPHSFYLWSVTGFIHAKVRHQSAKCAIGLIEASGFTAALDRQSGVTVHSSPSYLTKRWRSYSTCGDSMRSSQSARSQIHQACGIVQIYYRSFS